MCLQLRLILSVLAPATPPLLVLEQIVALSALSVKIRRFGDKVDLTSELVLNYAAIFLFVSAYCELCPPFCIPPKQKMVVFKFHALLCNARNGARSTLLSVSSKHKWDVLNCTETGLALAREVIKTLFTALVSRRLGNTSPRLQVKYTVGDGMNTSTCAN